MKNFPKASRRAFLTLMAAVPAMVMMPGLRVRQPMTGFLFLGLNPDICLKWERWFL